MPAMLAKSAQRVWHSNQTPRKFANVVLRSQRRPCVDDLPSDRRDLDPLAPAKPTINEDRSWPARGERSKAAKARERTREIRVCEAVVGERLHLAGRRMRQVSTTQCFRTNSPLAFEVGAPVIG